MICDIKVDFMIIIESTFLSSIFQFITQSPKFHLPNATFPNPIYNTCTLNFIPDNSERIVHCVTRGRSVCFYGEGKHFPNRRNDLPRVTDDTFFDIPYDFDIFRTRGSVSQLCFSKLQSGGKTLICKRWR